MDGWPCVDKVDIVAHTAQQGVAPERAQVLVFQRCLLRLRFLVFQRSRALAQQPDKL